MQFSHTLPPKFFHRLVANVFIASITFESFRNFLSFASFQMENLQICNFLIIEVTAFPNSLQLKTFQKFLIIFQALSHKRFKNIESQELLSFSSCDGLVLIAIQLKKFCKLFKTYHRASNSEIICIDLYNFTSLELKETEQFICQI